MHRLFFFYRIIRNPSIIWMVTIGSRHVNGDTMVLVIQVRHKLAIFCLNVNHTWWRTYFCHAAELVLLCNNVKCKFTFMHILNDIYLIFHKILRHSLICGYCCCCCCLFLRVHCCCSKLGIPKKKQRNGKDRIPQPKNTVAMLNELRHGLIYKLESQTGPVHAPLFTISVEVSSKPTKTHLFILIKIIYHNFLCSVQ